MTSTPTQFYTTNADSEEVFQEVRHALDLHRELLDASPEQAASFVKLKTTIFEVETALEALRNEDGELLP